MLRTDWEGRFSFRAKAGGESLEELKSRRVFPLLFPVSILIVLAFLSFASSLGFCADRLETVQSSRFELASITPSSSTPPPPILPVPSGNTSLSSSSQSSDEIQVTKGLRVIVFSPHPDDECLAAAGLMERVIELGGELRVVFVTNGDGYPEAISLVKGTRSATVDDFINYGRLRHDEALQALCELGIRSEDAIFLGFPDGGIDDLLTLHWSTLKPYTSPYTRFNQSRYKESYNRWVSYAGVNLRDVMAKVIETFSPDWIILPDPRDDHPDHCATGVFVLDALRKLNQEGDVHLGNMQFFTYLVHFRGYPSSSDWINDVRKAGIFMSPFASSILASTRWFDFPLTRAELDDKERSITAYQSQHQLLGGFFQKFLTFHETFGRLDSGQVLAIPQEYARHFRSPNI